MELIHTKSNMSHFLSVGDNAFQLAIFYNENVDSGSSSLKKWVCIFSIFYVVVLLDSSELTKGNSRI